jgi:hypothetical protein
MGSVGLDADVGPGRLGPDRRQANVVAAFEALVDATAPPIDADLALADDAEKPRPRHAWILTREEAVEALPRVILVDQDMSHGWTGRGRRPGGRARNILFLLCL